MKPLLRVVALALAACHGPTPAPIGSGPASVTIAGPDEPGRRLVLTGRILDAGGRTPLAGARLDVYHTDAGGFYTRPVSVARRARLRGSVWTDAAGRYEIRTILPGKYPSGGEPAHVHAHLAVPGWPEHWIPSFLFAGDPDLEPGDGPVVTLVPDEGGTLHGVRDIRFDPELALENRLVDGWYRGE